MLSVEIIYIIFNEMAIRSRKQCIPLNRNLKQCSKVANLLDRYFDFEQQPFDEQLAMDSAVLLKSQRCLNNDVCRYNGVYLILQRTI